MARIRFTHVYDKTRSLTRSHTFAGEWDKFLTETAGLKSVFSSVDGPNFSRGKCLDNLRSKAKEKAVASEGALLLQMAGINPSGTQTLTDTQVEALASLKLARHFYLQQEKGAQSVWIYAPPFSHHKWVFDELKGTTPSAAKAKLDKADEVYPNATRKHMANGVTKSLGWCQKCAAKLGKPDAATEGLVKTWFCETTPSDEAMKAAVKTLLDGFKKLAAMLGSTKLIFSDDPWKRMQGTAVAGQSHYRSSFEDYAFVAANAGERLDVVYIQNATLKKWASSDEAWMATLAIIHELSHRVLLNKDVVYDYTGLKPSDKLTYEHAIRNADSWAYFAADLNGALTQEARDKYYKSPARLRQSYLDSLGS